MRPAGEHILTISTAWEGEISRINIKDNIKDKYQVPGYGEVLRVGGHGNVCTSVDAVQLEVCRL